MEVVELEHDGDEAYERFVVACPTALFYHSLRFRDFLVCLLGCEPRYAVALKGSDVLGVLPLMSAEGPYGRVLNSLPYFGSNGGVVAANSEAGNALHRWYEAELASADVAAGTIIGNPLDPDPSALPRGDLEDTRVGHITSLQEPSIDASARRNVQKALRNGVEVEVENESFAVLETLHVESMTAIGGQAKTPAFFAAVQSQFRPGEDYNLYLARVEGTPVAGLLLFYFGFTVEYYVPAVAVAFRSLQPMAAILRRAMDDAASRGFRLWNWGGSWIEQDSLIRFKSKWGGQRRIYRYWTRLQRYDLLSISRGDLLSGYPGFYVVPFSALETSASSAPT
jgi:hypothetical protein